METGGEVDGQSIDFVDLQGPAVAAPSNAQVKLDRVKAVNVPQGWVYAECGQGQVQVILERAEGEATTPRTPCVHVGRTGVAPK